MPPREITPVLEDLSYLECPRWHRSRIWVADFYTAQVLSAREDGSDLRVEAEVPEQPSGIGWLPDGRLLVVSMRDARILRREDDGTLVTHAELADHVTGHPNDMVVDAQGRAYVGNFGFDLMAGADIETAALLRVDPDGSVQQVAEDLWFPNGSVITDDGVLIVDETFGNRISAFDIQPDGALGPRRDWARFADPPSSRVIAEALADGVVAPDGCALDAEGHIWAADAMGTRAVRVAPGGAVAEELEMPEGLGTYACMLGGADGRTLFICTAPDFQEEARKNAREASLVTARVDTPRAGLP
jgi:sugar lactone lactonase YvrE